MKLTSNAFVALFFSILILGSESDAQQTQTSSPKEVAFVFLHFDNIHVAFHLNGQEIVNEVLFDPEPSVGLSKVVKIYPPTDSHFLLRYGDKETQKRLRIDDEVKVIYITYGVNTFEIQRGTETILLD